MAVINCGCAGKTIPSKRRRRRRPRWRAAKITRKNEKKKKKKRIEGRFSGAAVAPPLREWRVRGPRVWRPTRRCKLFFRVEYYLSNNIYYYYYSSSFFCVFSRFLDSIVTLAYWYLFRVCAKGRYYKYESDSFDLWFLIYRWSSKFSDSSDLLIKQ